jgi:hypothetical protein
VVRALDGLDIGTGIPVRHWVHSVPSTGIQTNEERIKVAEIPISGTHLPLRNLLFNFFYENRYRYRFCILTNGILLTDLRIKECSDLVMDSDLQLLPSLLWRQPEKNVIPRSAKALRSVFLRLAVIVPIPLGWVLSKDVYFSPEFGHFLQMLEAEVAINFLLIIFF